ncbi:hypothetical protein HUF15_39130 [Streptomyces samsunensis]|nr:transposase [Streptomyces malaysiensis]NUH42658.1 hypothetical protein [Streptomyces samsunensis]
MKKLVAHWPDVLLVTGSLVNGQVRAYDLLRMFGRGMTFGSSAGARRPRLRWARADDDGLTTSATSHQGSAVLPPGSMP